MNKIAAFSLVAVCLFAVALGEATFTPNPLPCEYYINGVTYLSNASGVYATQTDRYFVQDNMLKYYGTVTGDKDDKVESVLRPDLFFEENGTKYIKAFGGDSDVPDECKNENMTVDESKKFIEDVLFYFYQTKKFDEMVSGEFQGQKCNLYKLVSDDDLLTYYVDEDNVLLGVSNLNGKPNTTEFDNLTSVFTYKYDEIPLSEFALSKDIVKTCADEVYAAPTERLCSSPSSTPAPASSVTPASSGKKGSSSDATTTKAVVAMILMSLAVALF